MFGLQFYGECWSGETGLETFNRFRNASDQKCVMDLQFTDNKVSWKHCDIASDQVCVGKASTNYVYVLEEGTCQVRYNRRDMLLVQLSTSCVKDVCLMRIKFTSLSHPTLTKHSVYTLRKNVDKFI